MASSTHASDDEDEVGSGTDVVPSDPDSQDEDGKNELLTRKDLDRLMVDFQASTLQAVHEGNLALQRQLSQSIHSVIKRYDQGIRKKFQVVDTALVDMQKQIDELKEQNRRLFAKLDNVASDVAFSQALGDDVAKAQAALDNEEFDRDPLPHTLRLNLDEVVEKAVVQARLDKFIADERCASAAGDLPFRLDGPDAGKNFSVVYPGGPVHGGRRARAFWKALRKDDGTWHRLYVKSPAGRDVQLWVSLDASPKQRARMALGKRALLAAED